MTKIDMSRSYKTRDGREVRIYATDGGEPLPVHGAYYSDNGWHPVSWREDGMFNMALNTHSIMDLIEVKPRVQRTVWLDVLEDGYYNVRTEQSDNRVLFVNGKGLDKLACIEIKIDCEIGEGLSNAPHP
jgi:hypothetical protein